MGALYGVLWVVWGLVTALGRERRVASLYDKSQRVFTALGGPIMIALIVVAPWEYAYFAGPIPRDRPLAWIGLALYVPPYRLIYAVQGETLYLLRFEHRKTAYR